MPFADITNGQINGQTGFKMHYAVINGIVPHDTLFIHGNTGSNRWWIPTVQVLREQSKKRRLTGRAIFAEWRGCGQSSAPANASELQPALLGRDYVELLEKLGIESASIVGHSLGGLIALHAVAAKPHLFKRLLLVNSVGPKGIPYDDSAFEYFERIPSSHASAAHALSFSFHDHNVDPTLFDRLVDDTMKMAPINWKNIWRMLSRFDGRDVVSTVTLPTLVIHGAQDKVLPLDEAHALMATLPNARLVVLENYGHAPSVENAGYFTSILNSFLYEENIITEESSDESRDDRGHRPIRTGQGRPEFVL